MKGGMGMVSGVMSMLRSGTTMTTRTARLLGGAFNSAGS